MNTENVVAPETLNTLSKNPPTLEQDGFFYHEMMTHSVLFMHAEPKKVALLGDNPALLAEILKHPNIEEVIAVAPTFYTNSDPRVKSFIDTETAWLEQATSDSIDVIIQSLAHPLTQPLNSHYNRILRTGGLLICSAAANWTELSSHSLNHLVQAAGFKEGALFHFPDPQQARGWHFAFIASKTKAIHRIREKDIYNRSFKTRAYNLDMHKAALALPEFIQSEL